MLVWYYFVSLRKDSSKSLCCSFHKSIRISLLYEKLHFDKSLFKLLYWESFVVIKRHHLSLSQCIPPVETYFLSGFSSCYYSQSQLDRGIWLGITNQLFWSQSNCWILWFLKSFFPNPRWQFSNASKNIKCSKRNKQVKQTFTNF